MKLFFKHFKRKGWNMWCYWRGYSDSLLPRLYFNRIECGICLIVYFSWYKLEFYIATKDETIYE